MNTPEIFFATPSVTNFHRRETGVGLLRASNGSEVGCRFVLEQAVSGSITLRCLLDTVQNQEWPKRPIVKGRGTFHTSLSFDLETDSGYHLENLQFHPTDGGVSKYGHEQSLEFDLSVADLRRTRPVRFERPVAFADFSIVNFEIDGGNACVRLSELTRWDDNVVALKLGDQECWLHAVKNANDIITKLKATQGIDVTATCRLPMYSLDEWDAIQDRVDNLCTVLTLISGNRVTWISTRAIDSYGYALLERWRHSVTRPYTTHDVLNIFSDKFVTCETTDYLPIIERMMSCFEEAEQKWNIRAVINTWHETVISDHYFEQRGMLVVVCMEMLRTCYLKHGGGETAVAVASFHDREAAFVDDLKKTLKVHFPTEESWSDERVNDLTQDLLLLYEKRPKRKRLVLKEIIEQIAHEFSLISVASKNPENDIRQRMKIHSLDEMDADKDQLENSIGCFIKIRNNLTHNGEFILTDDDRENNQNESSMKQRSSQLEFLQRFVAAFLCSSLGWTQRLPPALNLPK